MPSGPRPAIRGLRRRGGFTLIEILVVMIVISMLAAIAAAALAQTRNAARASKTKATIAKLHALMMRKYELYLTRRISLDTTGLKRNDAAKVRLMAIRDLMRMEMPDRFSDVLDPAPATLAFNKVLPTPPVTRIYQARIAGKESGTIMYESAECLYLTVMTGSADARELFKQDEIGDTNGNGLPEFIDGWGNPIMWLRWAPGFTPYSNIQVDDTSTTGQHHDPLDPLKLEPAAYHLLPLIFSSGGSRDEAGVAFDTGRTYKTNPNPYATAEGQVTGRMPMTNHNMTQE